MLFPVLFSQPFLIFEFGCSPVKFIFTYIVICLIKMTKIVLFHSQLKSAEVCTRWMIYIEYYLDLIKIIL